MGITGVLCQILLGSALLAVFFLKSNINDEKGEEPPGFNDSSVIPPPPPRTMCLTRECIEAAANIIENMNPKVNPCDDWYEYACGSYYKYHDIPPGAPFFETLVQMQIKTSKKVKKVLSEPPSPSEQVYEKTAKQFFQNCLDTDDIEKRGKDYILQVLKSLPSGWPVLGTDTLFSGSWEKELGKITHIVPVGPIITSTVYPNPKNSKELLLSLAQGEFALNDVNTYKSGTQDPAVLALKQLMIDTAILLGADKDTAKADMEEVLELEVKLGGFALDLQQRNEPSVRLRIESRSNLKTLLPDLELGDLIDASVENITTIGGSTEIHISDFQYFENIQSIMKNTKRRVIANYFGFSVIKHLSADLFGNIRTAFHKFTTLQMGMSNMPEAPRDEKCLQATSKYFPYPVGRLYARKYFDKQKIVPLVSKMVEAIRDGFKKQVNESVWVDSKTKEEFYNKLNMLKYSVGYADGLEDNAYMKKYYGRVFFNMSNTFTENINMAMINDQLLLRKFINQINSDELPTDAPTQVDAYYSPSANTMTFLMGILSSPVFASDVPAALNFGSLGHTIGHEMQHGYDSRGRAYDGFGNFRDWWEPDALKTFNEKSQCFVDAYNAENVNGILSLGENMADNNGLKSSFLAYKTWLKNHPEEDQILPGLTEFTSDQYFFLSHANFGCSIVNAEAEAKMGNLDPHPFSHKRISITVKNSKEFSTAFKCPEGSPMNPVKKCTTW